MPWGYNLFLLSLQNDGHALTAADAQRRETIAGIAIYHGVDQFVEQNAAAG